jgi:glycosyltransferase involved in cell wall biosynthesis
MSVAVVIPAYNAEPFIRRAVDSVLGQTVPPDRLIVIDDGSRDNTRAILESYGDRLELLTQQNQGPSVARNRALKMIDSEFVAFVDADDAWEPTKIERQLEAFAANPGAVLCYTGIRVITPSGAERVHSPIAPDDLHRTLRFTSPGIPPSCMMFRTQAYRDIGGFNTALRGIDDWDFVARMSRRGPFCRVREPLLRYYALDVSLSSDADRIFGEVRKMLDPVLLEGLSGPSRWIWRQRILSFQAYKAGLTSRASKNPRELRYMIESLLAWPLPTWYPVRFKGAAVSLKNSLLPS